MPAKHFVGCTGLTGTAASVNIDVYGESGTLIGNVANSKVVRIGSTTSYVVDLRRSDLGIDIVPPIDGQKLYTLVWKDDAPSAIHRLETVQGLRRLYGDPRETVIYPSTSIPSRGITPSVIAEGKPSYLKLDFSRDGSYDAPDFTLYEVIYYDSSGRSERYLTSLTPPNP